MKTVFREAIKRIDLVMDEDETTFFCPILFNNFPKDRHLQRLCCRKTFVQNSTRLRDCKNTERSY